MFRGSILMLVVLEEESLRRQVQWGVLLSINLVYILRKFHQQQYGRFDWSMYYLFENLHMYTINTK